MSKPFQIQLLAALISGSVLLLGACSAEKPVRYVSSAKTSSNAEGSKKPSTKDEGEDIGEDDNDSDEPKKTEPEEKEPEEPVKTDPKPETKPDPVPETKPDPVPEQPKPDPAADAKAKLLEACAPKSFQIKDETNGVEGYAIFTGVFQDANKELRDIAINDCVNMYKTADEVKAVKRNNLTIVITVDNHDGVAYANPVPNTQISNVHISTGHIRNYKNASANDRKIEFYGVMSHEINHLYQNFGNNTTPYTEGLCDAIRADADYYPRSRKVKGGSADGSYTYTGYFLRYLRKKKDPDFYFKFNAAIPKWNENFWQQTFGMSRDALWNEYQQKGFDPNDY